MGYEPPTIADEMFTMLGRIQSDVAHLRDTAASTDSKVESLVKNDARQDQIMKAAHRRIDEVTVTVKEHEALKNRGLGILTVVGFLFGLIGSVVGKFFFGGN